MRHFILLWKWDIVQIFRCRSFFFFISEMLWDGNRNFKEKLNKKERNFSRKTREKYRKVEHEIDLIKWSRSKSSSRFSSSNFFLFPLLFFRNFNWVAWWKFNRKIEKWCWKFPGSFDFSLKYQNILFAAVFLLLPDSRKITRERENKFIKINRDLRSPSSRSVLRFFFSYFLAIPVFVSFLSADILFLVWNIIQYSTKRA